MCSLLPLRTVLELGSGAGLTGLAICKMCHPRAYVFSDCHSLVLEQLRGNILLNGLLLESEATAPAQHPGHNTHNAESPNVTVAQLDWDIVTAPQLAAFQPDVIIAAGAIQPHVASICGSTHSRFREKDHGLWKGHCEPPERPQSTGCASWLL